MTLLIATNTIVIMVTYMAYLHRLDNVTHFRFVFYCWTLLPVRVPVDFYHPFPKVQVDPDPNADGEGGQGQEEADDVKNEHNPLVLVDDLVQVVHVVRHGDGLCLAFKANQK